MRTGANTLVLLGTPRVVGILECLAEGARDRQALRGAADFPPPSTLRSLLRVLEEGNVIAKRKLSDFPGTLEYELTAAGHDLLTVAAPLRHWLAEAPGSPLELGGNRAKAAIKGFVEGWNATILIKLSVGPLSLTELDKRVTTASYSTIERALETMRLAGELDVGEREPRGAPYSLNDWTRRGFVPLAHAVRWEHRHAPAGVDPVQHLDLESACAILSPLLDIPAGLYGRVEMAAAPPSRNGHDGRLRGTLAVESGRLSFGAVDPDSQPDAWASASIDDWFAILTDGDTGGLKLNGEQELVQEILFALRRLFSSTEADTRMRAAKQGAAVLPR